MYVCCEIIDKDLSAIRADLYNLCFDLTCQNLMLIYKFQINFDESQDICVDM